MLDVVKEAYRSVIAAYAEPGENAVEAANNEFLATLTRVGGEIDLLQAQNVELQESVNAHEARNQELSTQNEDLTSQVQSLQDEIEQQVADHNNALSGLQVELETITEANKQLAEKVKIAPKETGTRPEVVNLNQDLSNINSFWDSLPVIEK